MTDLSGLEPSARAAPIERCIVAIEAANSLEFLRAAFDCYVEGRLFAVTRPDIDPHHYADRVVWLRHDRETRGWGRLDHVPSESDAPAQIVFSSGTEGRPKAIVLSHRNLADVVVRLNRVMQVTDEIREYVGVPVTYSFGLGRIRAVSAAGGAFFLPERFDPFEIGRMLAAGEINAVSAVPSLWRLVLANPAAIGAAGAALRWIEIGSQYMGAADKAALKALFPNARIVQHYGMTEASRTTFLVVSDHDDPEVLESVGPAERVEISAAGAIRIRGAHVASVRMGEDGAPVPLTDSDGWLDTGDRGEIRDGHLYFLGRTDDQMNLSGIKVGAEALEARVAELLPAARGHFAITSVPDPMRGEAVLLAAEAPAAGMVQLLAEATRHALGERGVTVGAGLRAEAIESLPRTATGKIRRADLRRLADAAPAATGARVRAAAVPSALTPGEARIAAIWQRVVGDVGVAADESFYDTGGDSLSGLQVGLLMEAEGLSRAAVNATFEGRSLAEVAAISAEVTPGAVDTAPAQDAPLPPSTQLSWSLTLARAVVVISVLMSHWGPGLLNALSLPGTVGDILRPYTRMGTPGFAMVFGLGVGLYMLPQMDTRPESVMYRMRRAFFLVTSGIALLAVISLTHHWLSGRQIGGLEIAGALYGVLAYYAIMLGTARWWLGPLARLRDPVRDLLLISLALWAIWQFMRFAIPTDQIQGILEFPRLMLQAGYSVFKLGAMTAAGIAVGYWIAGQKDQHLIARHLILAGLLGMAFCGTMLIQASRGAITLEIRDIYTSLPGLAFYGSACLLLMGLFLRVVARWETLPPLTRGPLKALVVVGGMALPIFVFHQAVRPARDMLELMGLGGPLALALPLAIFLSAMGWLGWKLYRMYFA